MHILHTCQRNSSLIYVVHRVILKERVVAVPQSTFEPVNFNNGNIYNKQIMTTVIIIMMMHHLIVVN